MKIAIQIPDQTFYGNSMMSGLAQGLANAGAKTLLMSWDRDAKQRLEILKAADYFIQINNLRTVEEQALKNCTFITWFQDIYSSDLDATFQRNGWSPEPQDRFYFLSPPEVLGFQFKQVSEEQNLGILFTGIKDKIFHPSHARSRPLHWGKRGSTDIGYITGMPSVFQHKNPPNHMKPDLKLRELFRSRRQKSSDDTRWGNLLVALSLLMDGDTLLVEDSLEMKAIAEAHYQPVTGQLDIARLSAELSESEPYLKLFKHREENHSANIEDYASKSYHVYEAALATLVGTTKEFGGVPRNPFYIAKLLRRLRPILRDLREVDILNHTLLEKIDYFSQVYPRIIDRQFLIKAASAVTESFLIWSNSDELTVSKPYYAGNLTSERDLRDAYATCKIQLHANNHGLALHSRVLEALACKSLVFIHSSGERDSKPGGIDDLAQVRDGIRVYTHENIHEKLSEELFNFSSDTYLKEQEKKLQKTQQFVLENHTWDRRGEQIVKDLHNKKS